MADVRDYGAVGDGVTDDTTSIQSALTAASSNNTPLLISPGRYKISDILTYGSNLLIHGLDTFNKGVLVNATDRSGDTTMLIPEASEVHNVTFRDLIFDQRGDVYDVGGDATDDFLCSINETIDVSFVGCEFRNARTMALWSDSTTAPTQYTKITGCRVISTGGGGFSFFGPFTDFTITNNYLRHTQDDAIAIQSTSAQLATRGQIKGNKIRHCDLQTLYGATPHGILVYGASYVDVEDNDIANVFASSIQVSAGGGRRASNVRVTNNHIRGTGTGNPGTSTPAYGIFLLDADHVKVLNNDVLDSLDGDFFQTTCSDVVEEW